VFLTEFTSYYSLKTQRVWHTSKLEYVHFVGLYCIITRTLDRRMNKMYQYKKNKITKTLKGCTATVAPKPHRFLSLEISNTKASAAKKAINF